jgi:hypothetical protein
MNERGRPWQFFKEEVLGDKNKIEEPKKTFSQGVRWFIVVMKRSNSRRAKEPG